MLQFTRSHEDLNGTAANMMHDMETFIVDWSLSVKQDKLKLNDRMNNHQYNAYDFVNNFYKIECYYKHLNQLHHSIFFMKL